LGNLTFVSGFLLHLDGIRRFLGLKPLDRSLFIALLTLVAFLAVFYFYWDSPEWRGLISSTIIAAIHWNMAVLILKRAASPKTLFYKVIASLLGLGGLLLLVRAIWLVAAQNESLMFQASYELGFFISFVVLHLGENLSLLMLNSERLESELLVAQAELRKTIASLEKALNEKDKSEEILRQSEEKYRNFFDTSRDCVFMTTLDGRFIEFNDVALELLGYRPDEKNELLARQVMEFYAHPEQRASHASLVAEKGFSKEYPVDLIKRDGTILRTLITTVTRKDAFGNTIGFQGTVRDITEKVKAEEALKQSEEKLRLFIEHAPTAIAMFDTDMRYVAVSRRWITEYSLPDPNIIGRSHYDVFPEIPERWKSAHRLGLKGEVVRAEEDFFERANGSSHWLKWEVQPWHKSDGVIGGTIIFSEDISELKKREEILKSSLSELQTIYEYAPVMMCVLDEQRSILYANKTFLNFVGRTLDQLKNGAACGVFGCINALDDPRGCGFGPKCSNCSVRSAIEDTFRTGTGHREVEYRTTLVRGAVNQEVVLFCSTALIQTPGSISVLLCLEDFTDRERVQRKLLESEANLWDLYYNAPNAYFSVDAEGVIKKCNKKAEELLGYTGDMLIGRKITDFYIDTLGGRQKTGSLFREFVSGRPIVNEELQMLKADGSPLWINLSISSVRDQDGKIVESRLSVTDITDRKKAAQEREQLKEQLFQSQKFESIGTLTGGIAHDMNNLLTIINGYIELLLLSTEKEDPRYEDLQKVLKTGLAGAEMIQKLQSFSKTSEINLKTADLNRIVEDAVLLLKRTFPKLIEVKMISAKDLAIVNVDESRLRQIIMNLCMNAKEAMPDGGRLVLKTENIVIDSNYCKNRAGTIPGNYVILSVSDSGIGMSREILDRLFDPFFTTKGWDYNKGTGLSLSVAKSIIEQHGGWITCESLVGVGTTFRVFIPAVSEPENARISLPEPKEPNPIKCILVVDDEEHVRGLAKRVLESFAYTVLTARNGEEALEVYKLNRSRIDLVVLDLMMPRLGGEKCLDELLMINPAVKVIISTGYILDPEQKQQLDKFVKGFLDKPYQVDQLLQVIKKAMADD
jgi:PAS domain S-box-containing protein